VIRSCRDKETEKLVRNLPSQKFQAIERAARAKLVYLKSARNLRDLSMPGLRLEKLSGDRQGQYSIRINDQYRICFEWREDGAYHVEITDYH
jgi:proteic killer suppression protein